MLVSFCSSLVQEISHFLSKVNFLRIFDSAFQWKLGLGDSVNISEYWDSIAIGYRLSLV